MKIEGYPSADDVRHIWEQKPSLVFEINPQAGTKFNDVDEVVKKILDTYSGKCEVHIKVAGFCI